MLPHPELDSVSQAIVAVIEGKVSAVATLASESHSVLLESVEQLGMLPVLTGDAVAGVLESYVNREEAVESYQAWASFVKRGYVAPHRRADSIRPLEINWEDANEEHIAEALMRLDELGDLIDGELTNAEANGLIALLRAASPGTKA